MAHGASAQAKRVAVEQFYGPRADAFREMLVEHLAERSELDLVPRDKLQTAIQQLGLQGQRLEEQDYVEIARALQIDAFVDGSVGSYGGDWELAVRVYNGYDGVLVGETTWEARSARGLRRARRDAYKRLAPLLAVTRAPRPKQPESPAKGEGKDGGRTAQDQAEPEPLRAREDGQPRPTALQASLLIGTLHRSLSAQAIAYDFGGAGSEPLTEQNRNFNSAGLGNLEAGLEVEVYPGAFLEEPIAPWLGLIGRYRRSFFSSLQAPACTSSADCPSGPVDIGTSQDEWYLGVRANYQVGSQGDEWRVLADVGYGTFNFVLEPEDLLLVERDTVVPPFRYQYLNLGAGIQLEVLPKYLTVSGRFAYRHGFEVGAQARSIWGVETDGFTGWWFGLEALSEADYLLDGVFWGVYGELFRFSTTFEGQTQCIQPPPGGQCGDDPQRERWEPWPEDTEGRVIGGLVEPVGDLYFRVGLKVGWRLTL